MAQNHFANHTTQYPQQLTYQRPAAGHLPPQPNQPPGQYDPRFYQPHHQQHYPQYYQQQQQQSSAPQFSQPQQVQRSYSQQHLPQQHISQPSSQPTRFSSSPQPHIPISSSFVPTQYRPPPSPQPVHSFVNHRPSSPQHVSSSQTRYSRRSQSTSQPPSTPSPTRQPTTTASPTPRYAYLPQQPILPSDSHSSVPPGTTRPLPTPRGRPESMPPPPRSPMPSPVSMIRQLPVSPPRSSRRTPLPTTVPPPSSFHPSLSSAPPTTNPVAFSSRPISPGRHGRPLPTPVTRSTKTQSLDMGNRSARAPSPVKVPSLPMSQDDRQMRPSTSYMHNKQAALPPAENPGQPFVPHWKRNTLSQLPSVPTNTGYNTQRRGTVSGPMPNRDDVGPTRGVLSHGRPLPAFPNSAPETSTSLLNGADYDRSQDRTPSPQYGILDMPRSRLSTQVEMKRESNGARKPMLHSNSSHQQVPTQSLTLQMASMSLDGHNNPSPAKAPVSLSNNWPASLPPLPRAPKSPAKQEIIDLDDAPPPSLRRSPSFSMQRAHSRPPSIPSLPTIRPQNATPQRTTIPKISFPADPHEPDSDSDGDDSGPMISISVADTNAPRKAVSTAFPQISVGSSLPALDSGKPPVMASLPSLRRSGLSCGGCGGAIIGRIVSAMNLRWHPGCFRCCVCNELLENLSSYEKDGKPYCHLDYHEAFAPKCYHCHTTIVDEQFITLDDHELGRRTYHAQHFFCAECGDPFLPPSSGSRSFAGDGAFEDDDVGFTVYKGHPYCESCHVRLRLPKCKRCKKSIRDGARAVEALGGKWCWGCFVCANCEQPFENPSFFQRNNQPFCEKCFSIMIRNEM